MKNLFIAVIVIFLLVVGIVLLSDLDTNKDNPPQNGENMSAGQVRGIVTEVDLEGVALDGPALITLQGEDGETHVIAVPSMGLPLCPAYENISNSFAVAVGDRVEVLGDVNESDQIVPCEDPAHYLSITGVETNTEIGYSFEYPKGAEGYVVVREGIESDHADFVSGLQLFEEQEYQLLQQSTEPREGPPVINFRVYENTESLDPSVWALQNNSESNIELAFEDPEEAVVGGANAVLYTADGLFPIETYVIAHGGYMFILSVMYPDMEAKIYQDFQDIVDSFTFIQAEGQE